MTFPFNPRYGLVIVPAKLRGPGGESEIRLAIDTGASFTLISSDVLSEIRCFPITGARHRRIATISGLEDVAVVRVESLSALGSQRSRVPVIFRTLPAAARVDGLL